MTLYPRLIVAAALLLEGLGIAGPAHADHLPPGDPDNGKSVYFSTCVACHGKDGKGAIPGAPNLAKKGGALSKPEDTLLDHVENGFQSKASPIAMPANGGNPNLTEQDVVDVLAYMEKAFPASKGSK